MTSKAVVSVSANPAQGFVCANETGTLKRDETGKLRGDASEAIRPHVAIDLIGVLQKPEGVCPRAGATYGDVPGSGALVAGQLKHGLGCDWKAKGRLWGM